MALKMQNILATSQANFNNISCFFVTICARDKKMPTATYSAAKYVKNHGRRTFRHRVIGRQNWLGAKKASIGEDQPGAHATLVHPQSQSAGTRTSSRKAATREDARDLAATAKIRKRVAPYPTQQFCTGVIAPKCPAEPAIAPRACVVADGCCNPMRVGPSATGDVAVGRSPMLAAAPPFFRL